MSTPWETEDSLREAKTLSDLRYARICPRCGKLSPWDAIRCIYCRLIIGRHDEQRRNR